MAFTNKTVIMAIRKKTGIMAVTNKTVIMAIINKISSSKTMSKQQSCQGSHKFPQGAVLKPIYNLDVPFKEWYDTEGGRNKTGIWRR